MFEIPAAYRLPFAAAMLGVALIFCVAAYLRAVPTLAMCAGIAAAYWEEQRDPRIYSAAAVEEASGVSTIAILRNEA